MAEDKINTRITILGSGTCVPSIERSSSSVLVETGADNLLVDLGPGTMRRLTEAGKSIFDITCILLSHFHPDHSAELAPFLFSSKYSGALRNKPLTIIGGKGLLSFFKALEGVYGHWILLEPGLVQIIEMSTNTMDSLAFKGFDLNSAPVAHNEESLAYRITDNQGKSLVYSGDTDFSENLVSLAQNADLLICESAMPDALKIQGHLTPSLAGRIAARAGIKKLILTHFYPECDKIDIEKECRAAYKDELLLAKDLMKINLRSYF